MFSHCAETTRTQLAVKPVASNKPTHASVAAQLGCFGQNSVALTLYYPSLTLG